MQDMVPRSNVAWAWTGQVTNMARQMVVSYGFSDIGPWTLQDQSAQSGDMVMRMMARNTISESLQHKIDLAVHLQPPVHYHHGHCASVAGLVSVPDLLETRGQPASKVNVMKVGCHSTSLFRWRGRQVRKIADQSYEVALKHIRDNREAIDSIVDELVERETITGEEFRRILGEWLASKQTERRSPAHLLGWCSYLLDSRRKLRHDGI